MELVVDTNVLFAAVFRSALSRELLAHDRLTLWTPEYGISEARSVLTRPAVVRRLGNPPVSDILLSLERATAKIRIAPDSTFQKHMVEAGRLAPHPEDAPFLALAILLGIPIWSNDIALKKSQSVVRVYATHELLKLLNAQA